MLILCLEVLNLGSLPSLRLGLGVLSSVKTCPADATLPTVMRKHELSRCSGTKKLVVSRTASNIVVTGAKLSGSMLDSVKMLDGESELDINCYTVMLTLVVVLLHVMVLTVASECSRTRSMPTATMWNRLVPLLTICVVCLLVLKAPSALSFRRPLRNVVFTLAHPF